ncbi:MAG: sialate O-acetylesterase [Planctomycetaceae bacterium]
MTRTIMTSTSSALALLLLPMVCTAAPVQEAKQAPEVLKLSGMFKDHMVFQRECDAAVWGRAKPGSAVVISPSWTDQSFRATADNNGKWRTTIKTTVAGGPHEVTVRSGSEVQQLTDVLVGEVWICSGQSNMQWKLRGFGIDHFKEDVEKAKHPRIRFCDVPQVIALEGQDEVDARWTVCNPRSALAFSAVGYFFGSRLHKELDVPIGLISTNWGGSSAEAWVSPEVLKKDFPEFDPQYAKNKRLAEESGTLFSRGKKKPPKGLNQRNPSVLYNSMIRPLIPFSFRGVVWYQGESNVKKPGQYRTLFPVMIRDWRTRWNRGNFPFYFVQIAPFSYKREPHSAAFLREAQTIALSEPKTGMVVTMDIGNPGNIHPKQKKPVGERLALLALKNDYGRKNLVASGPMYAGHEIENGTIRLRFSSVGAGLVSRDGEPLSHFTIAGSDQNFLTAKAAIDGQTIVVSSDEVTEPVSVRFGWGSGDMPNLSNKDGLPASSFRTDDWPMRLQRQKN